MFIICSRRFITVTAFSVLVSSLASFSHAHEEPPVTMDPEGTTAQFTGYAIVTCSTDENGVPDNLSLTVEDLSPPVPGLLVSVQSIHDKSGVAGNTTDQISGDGKPSDPVVVHGGPGNYHILVNKTGAGARTFHFVYHCQTIDGAHTTTGLVVKQFR